MFKCIYVCLFIVLFFTSCDKVDNPLAVPSTDLDTNLYPGLWSDYENNEWPIFPPNINTERNVLLEEFTAHRCTYCPNGAEVAHNLEMANDNRVFVAAIHAGGEGFEEDLHGITTVHPIYPIDFTNTDGLLLGPFLKDYGLDALPRGTVNRVKDGAIFVYPPTPWTNLTNSILNTNDLKVNLQGDINYYPTTKGAFLHVEAQKLDANMTNDLAIVSYLIEDSLVAPQKGDNNFFPSYDSAYVHRDIHRKNLSGHIFGRELTSEMLINNKFYINYSFEVPNQLDGNHNPSNMHVLVYVYDIATLEIYQVIKVPIQ